VVSDQDLKPYFDRWIYDTGLPALSWTASTTSRENGFRTTVEVRPRDLPGPLPLQISVTTGAGNESHTLRLAPQGGSLTIDTLELPRRIALNEDRGVLARIERVGSFAQR
jgi:aminopeptidase N